MTKLPPSANPALPDRRWRFAGIVAVIAIGVAARVAVIAIWPDKLLVDTDAYLAYANAWAETGTFGYDKVPTAYRPPGYPWLLSLFGRPSFGWIATINVLCGAGTIWLVWLTARRMEMPAAAATLAAALIAVDPLLVRYAGFAMTESLCTFESALLLWLITHSSVFRRESDPRSVVSRVEWWRPRMCAFVAGMVCGLSVLSRPTFLVFVLLLLIFVRVAIWRGRARSFSLTILMLGAAIPVAGWGLRNQLTIGSPVLTTTHGGYTLLLGNNEAYYDEVVARSWRTAWDGSWGAGSEAWTDELNRSLYERRLVEEVERDRAMRDMAIAAIRDQPGRFVQACVMRCVSFWNIVPSSDARAGLPMVVVILVGVYYLAWWALAGIGMVQALRARAVAFLPALCLIIAFMAVHTVYWSNARMRAPVLPALALFAGYALSRRNSANVTSVAPSPPAPLPGGEGS